MPSKRRGSFSAVPTDCPEGRLDRLSTRHGCRSARAALATQPASPASSADRHTTRVRSSGDRCQLPEAWQAAQLVRGTTRAAEPSEGGTRTAKEWLDAGHGEPLGLAHPVELARGYVEDKTMDLVRAPEERACLDLADRLADVPRRVGERLHRPWRPDAGLFLDLALELVVGDLLQAAVSVVDQDDLGRAEQPLADRQRPDHVVGDYAARVADHLRFIVADAEQAEDVEPGVHAGDHRRIRGRPRRQCRAYVRAQAPAAS